MEELITGFYCGNNDKFKEIVNKILHDFGWTDIYIFGDISISRYTKMISAFWVLVKNKEVWFGALDLIKIWKK